LSKAKLLQVRVLALTLFLSANQCTDAHGDLLRGLQVVETAIGITSNAMGEKLEGTTSKLSA
jgi:hypothetical protein